jgi:hypothetical protein
MATRLKKWEFSRSTQNNYPWDDWTDGGVWKLKKGEDFDCSFSSIRGAAYREGKKRGMGVRSEILVKEKAVVLQFTENR